MGGTSSKNYSSVLTDLATEVAQKNVSKCVTAATQQQLIEAKNIGGSVIIEGSSMSQGVSIDMTCLMSSSNQAKLQNDLANEIVQWASAESVAGLSALGSTNAEAVSNIRTRFQNSVDLETIQESLTQSLQLQAIRGIDIGGDFIIRDVSLDQTTEIAARTIIESTSYADVINSVANILEQKSEAKEENFLSPITDAASGIASGISWIIIGAIAAAALILTIFIRYFFKSGVAAQVVDRGSTIAERQLAMTPVGIASRVASPPT